MQPDSLPALTSPLDGVPEWAHILIGWCLIGFAASILAAELRAALPPNTNDNAVKRLLHRLYPTFFGSGFAVGVPFMLPGLDVSTRLLLGILAPVLCWRIYDANKGKVEARTGVTLPSSASILAQTAAPISAPTPEPKP